MTEYTLEWDAHLTHEDIERFTTLQGLEGVSTYDNILTLYYEFPLASQQVRELASAVTGMLLEGLALLNVTVEEDDPVAKLEIERLVIH